MDGSGVMIMELVMWVGGLGFLFWLDRRNLNRAKAEAARRKDREAEATRRAGPAPALVPTAVSDPARKGTASGTGQD
jgi:hypothetical protein